MIFRRTPPREDLPAVLRQYAVGPKYECADCQVTGIGTTCWCCGHDVSAPAGSAR